MKSKNKNFSIRIGLLVLLFNLGTTKLFSQITIDENELGYDIGDADLSIVYDKYKQYVYGDYTIPRDGYVNAGLTADIQTRGMRELKYTGIGGGLYLRAPLLYALIHKNTKRFRIADDFGIGTFLSSNKLKTKDALTGDDIKFDQNLSSEPKVNFGITFYYGIQAMYRISNLLDVGIRYIPIFATGDSKVSNIGATYGVHVRVKRFYIDYNITPSASFTTYATRAIRKEQRSQFESNGLSNICVKYVISPAKHNTYLFASLNSYSYKLVDIYGNGGTFIPQGYENYSAQKSHFNIFKVGMGMMIF